MSGATEIGRMMVRLVGDGSQYVRTLDRAVKDTKSSAQQIDTATKQVTNSQKRLMREALASFGGVVAPFNSLKHAISSLMVPLGIAATAFTGLAWKATQSAMAVQESENLFKVSMGGMSEEARKWSEETAAYLNMNANGIRKGVGTMNVMLKSMGLSEKAAMEMAKRLTTLSYDMASFYNLDPEDTFQKLQAGMTGEAESLKRLGIIMNESTVNAYGMKHGFMQAGSEMSEMAKIASRFGVIMNATKDSHGDLKNTWDSATNLLRAAKEQTTMLVTVMGQSLLPMFSNVMLSVGRVLKVMTNLVQLNPQAAAGFVKYAIAVGLSVAALTSLAVLGPFVISPLLNIGKAMVSVVGIAGALVKSVMAMTFAMTGFGAASTVAGMPTGVFVATLIGLVGVGYLLRAVLKGAMKDFGGMKEGAEGAFGSWKKSLITFVGVFEKSVAHVHRSLRASFAMLASAVKMDDANKTLDIGRAIMDESKADDGNFFEKKIAGWNKAGTAFTELSGNLLGGAGLDEAVRASNRVMGGTDKEATALRGQQYGMVGKQMKDDISNQMEEDFGFGIDDMTKKVQDMFKGAKDMAGDFAGGLADAIKEAMAFDPFKDKKPEDASVEEILKSLGNMSNAAMEPVKQEFEDATKGVDGLNESLEKTHDLMGAKVFKAGTLGDIVGDTTKKVPKETTPAAPKAFAPTGMPTGMPASAPTGMPAIAASTPFTSIPSTMPNSYGLPAGMSATTPTSVPSMVPATMATAVQEPVAIAQRGYANNTPGALGSYASRTPGALGSYWSRTRGGQKMNTPGLSDHLAQQDSMKAGNVPGETMDYMSKLMGGVTPEYIGATEDGKKGTLTPRMVEYSKSLMAGKKDVTDVAKDPDAIFGRMLGFLEQIAGNTRSSTATVGGYE